MESNFHKGFHDSNTLASANLIFFSVSVNTVYNSNQDKYAFQRTFCKIDFTVDTSHSLKSIRGIPNKFPSNLFNTLKWCKMNLPKANIALLLLISAVSSE